MLWITKPKANEVTSASYQHAIPTREEPRLTVARPCP